MNTYKPLEFGLAGSQFNDSTGECFAVHEGRRVHQLIPSYKFTRDAHGLVCFAGRDNNAYAGMSTASHGTSAGVHHERDEEAGCGGGGV